MLILTKSVLAVMISFIIAVFLGTILIPVLRKLKASQRLSVYLEQEHRSKVGTPTMGGIIFIGSSLISLCMLYSFGKIQISYNFLIVIMIIIIIILIAIFMFSQND